MEKHCLSSIIMVTFDFINNLKNVKNMNFGEVSDDVRAVLDEVVEQTNLENFMNIYYYAVSKQKTVVKVSKLNPIGEAVSKKPGTVVITVVEEIFERLSPNQQKMLAEDAINQILYDDEKDKITIEAPAITMTLDGWRKYGAELANAYETSLLTVQQLEEEKKEAKAAAAEAKKSKRNQ